MKWLSVFTSPRQENYELRDLSGQLLALSYHPASETLRVSTDDEKRVFLINRKNFLRQRTVLRNEYGIRMGQLFHDGNQENQGTIDIDNQQFTYAIQLASPASISIFKNGDMTAACELPPFKASAENALKFDLLILMLGWFMTSTVRRLTEAYA